MQDENRPSGRRVGTFTLGVVLVVTGILMAVSLFWPQLDLRWASKALHSSSSAWGWKPCWRPGEISGSAMTGRVCCCASWWDWEVWRWPRLRGTGPIVPGNCTDGNVLRCNQPGTKVPGLVALLEKRTGFTGIPQEMREKGTAGGAFYQVLLA